MQVLVVTGSRFWPRADRDLIASVVFTADWVISGGAPGADSYADEAARELGIPCTPVHARWEEDIGPSAGKERNSRMVELAELMRKIGAIVVAHAFPTDKSVGTWDCVNKLKSAGFNVIIHKARSK